MDEFLARCGEPTWWTQTIAFTAAFGRVPDPHHSEWLVVRLLIHERDQLDAETADHRAPATASALVDRVPITSQRLISRRAHLSVTARDCQGHQLRAIRQTRHLHADLGPVDVDPH
jgi:hypothetical protein